MATTTRPGAVLAAARPTTVTAAAVLLAAMGVLGIAVLPLVDGGAGVIVVGTISLLRLVAAFGVWHRRRRAAILGFVVTALDALAALPGVFFADGLWWALATTGVVAGIAAMVLLAHRTSRRAYV